MSAAPLDPDLPVRPQPRAARLASVVSVGGGCGGLLRYALAQAWPHAAGAWPWATLLTNLTGAFLLGLLLSWLLRQDDPSPYVRPLLGTGVLGGYTTFSTFAVDGVQLLQAGRPGLAAAYVLASVTGVLAAVLAARVALGGRRWAGAAR